MLWVAAQRLHDEGAVSEPNFTSDEIDAFTKNEQDVLGWIYIGKDSGHSRRTIASLLKKGWIVEYEDAIPGTGTSVIDRLPLIVKRYTYPHIAAHMAWCEWCSQQPDEDGEG